MLILFQANKFLMLTHVCFLVVVLLRKQQTFNHAWKIKYTVNYTVMYDEVQLIQKKHPCVNLWTHFRDIAGSISLIQIPYATINTIYCGLGGLNKGRRLRQRVKMGSQNSTSMLKILSKKPHWYTISNIGRAITPSGKLFHIINIKYCLSIIS